MKGISLTCPLPPPQVCLPTVVEVFASITNHHEIVFCYKYSILEQNKRLILSSVTSVTSEKLTQLQNCEALNILDCFFPFDPYHLKRCVCVCVGIPVYVPM